MTDIDLEKLRQALTESWHELRDVMIDCSLYVEQRAVEGDEEALELSQPRSEDVGLSWQPVSALGDLEGQPLALADGPEVLWVATEDPRALYSSTDGGVTWELVVRS